MRGEKQTSGQSKWRSRGDQRDRPKSALNEGGGGWDDEIRPLDALRLDSISWANRIDEEMWG